MNKKILIAVILLLALIAAVFFLISQKPGYPDINTPLQFKGNPAAKVLVEEFSDFQCPACISTEPFVEEIFNQYKDRIKFQYRQFPLPMHQYGRSAAEASICSADFGKFWEYHDALFKANGRLDSESLAKIAKNAGIEEAGFKNCFYSGKKQALVQKEIDEGMQRGVEGTPTFFVNGEKVEGTRLSEIIANLKSKIEKKLKEVEQ